MSLWLRRKDPDGRTCYIASGAGVLVLMAVPILVVFIVSLLLWFRG